MAFAGELNDRFGRKVTVHAIGNPAKQNRKGRLETAEGEHVYSRRVKGDSFSPKVFAEGSYEVTIEAAGAKKSVTATAGAKQTESGEIVVDFTK